MRRVVAALLVLGACDSSTTTNTASSTTSGTSATGPDIVKAPTAGTVQEIVQREAARAKTDGRALVVYVGATWCEPCERFKDAIKAGQLDTEFPTLRVLEFDRDRDEQRLEAAGCISKLIPLFAKPTDDGRCDQRFRTEGGIKGPGTITFISRRLKAMLAAR